MYEGPVDSYFVQDHYKYRPHYISESGIHKKVIQQKGNHDT